MFERGFRAQKENEKIDTSTRLSYRTISIPPTNRKFATLSPPTIPQPEYRYIVACVYALIHWREIVLPVLSAATQ